MTIGTESSIHAGKTTGLFLDGYNYTQSVFTAFYNLYGMDERGALRLGSSSRGGMGRLREVCGAFSGIFMTTDLLYGCGR